MEDISIQRINIVLTFCGFNERYKIFSFVAKMIQTMINVDNYEYRTIHDCVKDYSKLNHITPSCINGQINLFLKQCKAEIWQQCPSVTSKHPRAYIKISALARYVENKLKNQ